MNDNSSSFRALLHYEDLRIQMRQEHDVNYQRYLSGLDCSHERREFRQKTNGIGQRCFFWQCTDCGVYQQIARAKLPNSVLPEELPIIDTSNRRKEVQELYWQEEERIRAKFEGLDQVRWEAEQKEADGYYSEYILSAEWRDKRNMVLERDGYLCQGCLRNKATQVHHLTYEHLGCEFMWELVSVCDECHRRFHGK